MPDTLTHTQVMRYNRQIVLPQFDLTGQEKLRQSSVLVLGVGGLGTALCQSLCASGVGALTLIDDDTVSHHNLPRQILFHDGQCGMRKVEAAKAALTQLNPDCQITALEQRQDDTNLAALVRAHDVVVDCTDNLDSRKQINRLSWQTGTPLVSGAAIRFEGQLFVSMPGQPSACYGCVEKLFSMPELSCTEAGILSPVVSMIGVAQAHLAIQVLVGFGTLPTNKLQLFDGLAFEWQSFNVPRHPQCDVCNSFDSGHL